MTEIFELPTTPLGITVAAAIGVLMLASLICLARAARGPNAADRLSALSLAMMNAVAILALLAITGSDWRYLDIALVLSVLFGALAIAAGRLLRARRAPPTTLQEKGTSHVVAD